MTDKKRYEFFVHLNDGQEVRWTNLTKRQAQTMYKWTTEHQLQGGFNSWGWEEVK